MQSVLAVDAIALMDALGVDKAIVVGRRELQAAGELPATASPRPSGVTPEKSRERTLGYPLCSQGEITILMPNGARGLTCDLANLGPSARTWLRLAGRGHGVQARRSTPGGMLVEQKRNRVADSLGGQA